MSTPRLLIGLMSGTSTDGVDGVLVRLGGAQPELLAQADATMPADLRQALLALNTSGPDELERAALAAQALVGLYADVVQALLRQARVAAADVAAIGVHGQTVRHRPDLGFTVQLNAPALLAERCGIDVVADFRSRDVAAGGQGAPLVPAFHAALFGADTPRAILNLGGIANVTLLAPGRPIVGFDTGPANMLLDDWCQSQTGQPYDDGGAYAASGKADDNILNYLLSSEPWLKLAPPKSTGRDLFNRTWLDQRLAAWAGYCRALQPQDIQATLQRFTARTAADAIVAHAPDTREVLICGGGVRNSGLMRDLSDCLQRPVRPTDEVGVPAQAVEAFAFAWLAQAFLDRVPAGLPEVTGASGPRILGALYPA
ncbi:MULTISPECIES: anhydro-N-acetylmuramic acid kinase [unclassified Achromobacter]|uniref:anhydro-N-acetylmuramic acid kinase n=1 Tax=unclassified Achromobacter TaxID=2626865 RepID=UPI000B51A4B8|nr:MULTISPECIES: anhydro-N-acetylmuramic acid kinase [unclassified Achromobacter]OWT75566.1 anhydro-N-acetylmuramic acid kinase [Achromobacter sp. HZ28]OWT76227.1 anhydro-N-acetylmuramic acid kinase [Achromobacter sp. HZ34]